MEQLLSENSVRLLLLFIPPFVFSLCLHEYAHAWAADRLGDSTARYMGRLTLDPRAHASLMGTIIFPAISLLAGAPLFGWANPVPVDMRNFINRHRLRMAVVAAAGPISNLLLAVVFTAILSFVVHQTGFTQLFAVSGSPGMAGAAVEMLAMGVQLNLFLAFFNLLPFPPLDGSRLIQGVVSEEWAQKIDDWSGWGQMLLLVAFILGILKVLAVPVYALMRLLMSVFGLL